MIDKRYDQYNDIDQHDHNRDQWEERGSIVQILDVAAMCNIITSEANKELSMDIEGFHLYHKGNEVVLTSKEFALLRLMLENQGKVFTRQMLLDRLWDDDAFVEDRIVDSHIKNIRKKLDADYIETIRGVGYRIDKEH